MSNYFLELALIHGVLTLGYWLLLRKERQYGKIRLFLLASILLAVLVPLFSLPEASSPTTPTASVVTVDSLVAEAATLAPPTPTLEQPWYQTVLVVLYALGTLFYLGKLLTNLGYLFYLRLSSRLDTISDTKVRRVAKLKSSFTFFHWIFVGDATLKQDTDIAVVLKHEQAHARLGHTYDLLLFQLFRALFWWLPTAWLANREIRKIHEYQADAYALKSYSLDRYSTTLISSTLTVNGLGMASSFHDGLILKRLFAMKQKTKKIQPWKLGLLSALCAALLVGFSAYGDPIGKADLSDLNLFTGDEPVWKAEVMPTFEGGPDAFYAYIINETNYPEEAREAGIEGRVYVRFIIDVDGSVTDTEVKRGLGYGCDEEALRVVQNSPGWTPGYENGEPVKIIRLAVVGFGNDIDPTPAEVGEDEEMKVDATYEDGIWSGTIKTQDGTGMPGVMVKVRGKDLAVITDLEGSFRIKTNADDVLEATFVGFKTAIIQQD